MSYLVLARKWRPRRFAELVGQEHVVRALSHALESGRVHHAFLFTGTRGVGKTTIARIFAKSLNCERGVSAEPCGECSTCLDVDAGRFLDLLEIDAASNTGVDDVRVLIESAQYTPARGRYKVYLVDEVHMLSKNAFNALLKTLEEPPGHVKFLLATTDPQKLPVTVLSRCLQFNLKRLSEEQIRAQLERILAAEAVESEPDALADLAEAGNGSLRDALSLLDQSIAYGGGAVRSSDVRAMLGTVARADVSALLRAIIADDAPALLAAVEASAAFAPDFALVLDELGRLLHRIALRQALGDAAPRTPEDEAVREFARALVPEDGQLLYQLAITGRRDLALAPSPRAGFEMTLLRMLAFRLAARDAGPSPRVAPLATLPANGPAGVSAQPPQLPAAPGVPAPASTRRAPPMPVLDAIPDRRAPPPVTAIRAVPAREPTAPDPAPDVSAPFPASSLDADAWIALVERLSLRGPARELANNLVLVALEGSALRLGVHTRLEHLRTPLAESQLRAALVPHLGEVRLELRVGDSVRGTLAERQAQASEARRAAAEVEVRDDPVLNGLIREFDARVVPGSVRPLE